MRIKLKDRLHAIDELLEQWRPRLLYAGAWGPVAQLMVLLRDMAEEIEALKARSDDER